MTSTDTSAPRQVPSVGELQAALEAARQGIFASTVPDAAPPAPGGELPSQPVTAPTPTSSAPTAIKPPAPVPARPADSPVVWLLGTHGASGARCLAAVLPATRYAGRHWPEPASSASATVLVCRSSHRGLTAAQDYARAYRDGEQAHHTRMLGLVVVADCPGRLPPPLRRREQLVSGAVPILGRVPWMPQWRLGPPGPSAELPKWVVTLTTAIAAAVSVPR